jgi:tape measure domain-containing protein
MSNTNEIEFTVRVKDEGLNGLAGSLEKVDGKTVSLGADAGAAARGVTDLGKSAQDTAKAVDGNARSIERQLEVERSEIGVQREVLVGQRQQQEALLSSARARGDALQATQAQNRLAQIEADQLALTARARRAEADAIQQNANARRQQLAAVGPLTQAQQQELQVAENQAKALRLQAGAADEAAGRQRALASATDGASKATSQLTQAGQSATPVLTKVAAAVAGAFAVDRLIEAGKSVSQVADEYKNLEARIRLSVGPNEDLRAAVEGVGRVANETFSSLDATATLYGRLAASGKELNITNGQALEITRTINQAIQVSGASSQASEMAVRQLVQGLQSGVLRGDEFNSVMEQAPRLAKALADGLGVPIGALRGMAEQGELTSAKVIGALKGQAEAINKEFGSLPVTTGRALEVLSTQWTLFVGSLTGGAQQSSIAAEGILALANNLETVAAVAARAGGVLTAALAVQGVIALKAFAAEMVATGAAASLLSLQLSKVPKVISITVAAVGFEAGFQIGEMLHNNSELARKLGVGITAFLHNMVNDLVLLKDSAAAIFTNDTVDAAFERYRARGREMDEHFSLMWKDAEEAPSKIGGAADAGAAAAQRLGAAGAAAGASVAAGGAQGAAGVGAVTQAAQDARVALDGLAKGLNARLPPDNGLADIVANLTAAKQRGVDLELLLRQQLPDAVSKLSGPELVKFRAEFIRAMDEAGLKGRELTTGLRLIGEQAAKSLGVDLVLAGAAMSKEFVDARANLSVLIRELPALKAAGVDTGLAVTQALSKMVDGARSKAELDAVRGHVEALRKVLGDKITDGLLDQTTKKAEELKDKINDITPGIQSLREAMNQLGLKPMAELQEGAKKTAEAFDVLKAKGQQEGESFVTWQARKQQAAIVMLQRMIEANGGVASEAIRTRAAMEGLEIQVDGVGRATVRAMGDASGATDALGRSAQGAAGDMGTLREQADAAADSARRLAEVNAKYSRPGGSGGKTQDGLSRNKDGSAAGTFDNALPVDQAYRVMQDLERGKKFSAADIDLVQAAYAQAKGAYDDMQAIMKLSPGAVSFANLQSTTALFNATSTALQQAKASGVGSTGSTQEAATASGSGSTADPSKTGSALQGSVRTVNINLAGLGTVRTDDEGEATVNRLMQKLQESAGRAS